MRPGSGTGDGLAGAGRFIFKGRDLLFPIVLVGIGLGTRPHIAGSTPRDHLMDLAGIAITLAGEGLRVLVIGLVYITRGGQNREIWANALVDRGIFAHCRNPLYVGNLLIIAGLAVVHNGWAMYAVAVPLFVFAYIAIVRAEEAYLAERFGDAYAAYCARVPRWIPSFTGLRATLAGSRFDWLKVLRKEYGTPFAWVSGLLLLLLWEHQSPGADPIGAGEVRAIVVAWFVAAAAYVVVRTLKLRGRLGTG